MKNLLSILTLLIILLSCAPSEKQLENDANGNITAGKCERLASFGDIQICLPAMEGMHECYTNPKVKAKADAFNYDGNSILAYYVNDTIFKQVENIDQITFDDYFQIYATNSLQNKKMEPAELNEMAELITNNFISENWDDLKKNIDKDLDYLTIGKPILIENYTPLEDVRSYVMIVKYQTELEEMLVVAIANIMRIKERLIWTAYYKNYEGDESIKKAKTANDFGVIQIMTANKE